ncbi:MAG TPA: hypothetical protein VFF19_10940, partial [Reyranella sp.]|nr:hypothetical protein [Reyranella sp.]
IASVQTANLPQALRIVRDRHPDLRVEVSLADRATRNGRAVTPTSDATKTPAVVAPPLIAMSVIGRMVAESK